jgi:hypothetical protein
MIWAGKLIFSLLIICFSITAAPNNITFQTEILNKDLNEKLNKTLFVQSNYGGTYLNKCSTYFLNFFITLIMC